MASLYIKFKRKIQYYWYYLLDNYFKKSYTASIADIVLNHTFDDRSLVVVSRLMDVENYYKGDKSFFYQNQLSFFSQGDSFNSLLYCKKFEELISSYQREGYNDCSRIIMDRTMYLFNGTHRTAMNLYYGLYEINVSLIPRKVKVYTSLEEFENGLPLVCHSIKTRFELLSKDLITKRHCLCCIINNIKSDQFDAAIELIAKYFTIVGTDSRINSLLVMMITQSPEFVVIKHGLVSKKAKRVEKLLKNACGDFSVTVSVNSKEGKIMIDEWYKI